jgi:predicted GNAT superfamily acetyltransferase
VVERLAAAGRGEAEGRRRAGVGASEAAPVNRVHEAGEWLAPGGHDLSLDAPHLAVTIPTDFTEVQRRNLPLAQDWRLATREIFTTYLARGYQVNDFLLDRHGCRGTYVLSLSREP